MVMGGGGGWGEGEGGGEEKRATGKTIVQWPVSGRHTQQGGESCYKLCVLTSESPNSRQLLLSTVSNIQP